MPTVFVVEDDSNIRELVVYTLNASGFETFGYADAEAFYAAMAAGPPQLVLLDIMLPGEDGLAVLRRLRAAPATKALPVVLLTARGTEYDKVVGLDAGADDYIAKPFGMMELVSRVKAVLRRAAYPAQTAQGKKPLSLGAIAIHPEKRTVTVGGRPLSLTLKEYELLLLLMENPGIVFRRDVLLERIWGYSYEGESRTVDVHVRSLRQKLGAAAPHIDTVRGVGYRFCEELP